MITLEINGVNYTNFLSINVERSIENVFGTFNFTATYAVGQDFPIKRGSSCRVLVNNTPIITGFVEKINIKYGASDHTISCQGRDSTCDIYDSQVDGDIEFVPPVTLDTIIKQTASKINITNLGVINEAGNIPSFGQQDLVSSRIGQTAFNFIETYSRKRQVFVTSDGQGNIVLARGSSQQIILGGLYNMIGDPQGKNNILDASADFDDTNRFNLYRCKSQGNPVTLNFTGDTAPADITGQQGTAIDRNVRSTRVLNFNAENSSFGDDVVSRAKWEANIRRVRSSTLSITVQGDSYDGINPWRVNRLVQVIDEFAGINAYLLIKSINFSLSLDQGTKTTLQLVTPDGYTPEANLPENKARTNNLGDQYILRIDE
jgi:prophage tail gpP-like protein